MLSTGRVALLAVALGSGVGVSDATRQTVSVTGFGFTFTIVAFDDGRNNPFRLQFTQDGTFSSHTFNRDLFLRSSRVGSERYRITYDDRDRLESVELTSSNRRSLLDQEEDLEDETAIEARRLDFDDCTTCEEAYDTVCFASTTVCDLEDFGPPLSAAAAASVDVACGVFGNVCSTFDANVVCKPGDQCTGEEVVPPSSSSNSCLDPTSSDYKCAFEGATTIEFTDCDLIDEDVAFLPACFEEFGNTNIVTLKLDSNSITSYAAGTFAGLSELTSLDLFSNRLIEVSQGLFDGLTKLEFLDLAFNRLTSLPEGAFSDLASLQTLRLFDNELFPETLPVGTFSGTPLLQVLFLDGNNLSDMTELEGLFDGLTELVELGLSENGIRTVPEGLFAGLTKLEDLSFFINQLTNLPDGLFSGLTALRSLELTDNNLTGFGTSLSGLTGLQTLRTEFNPLLLMEDSFSGLVNLEELELEGCQLTTLPAGVFSPLANLVELGLFDNEDLQCLPSTTATDIDLDSEDIRDGTCGCTPAEAVFCDAGFTCQSGMAGYTCVAE